MGLSTWTSFVLRTLLGWEGKGKVLLRLLIALLPNIRLFLLGNGGGSELPFDTSPIFGEMGEEVESQCGSCKRQTVSEVSKGNAPDEYISNTRFRWNDVMNLRIIELKWNHPVITKIEFETYLINNFLMIECTFFE